ncbi:calmodulin-like 3, partial [Coemansia erecta]
ADSDSNYKIQELNKAFKLFDRDGNGVITADELTAMLRSLSDYHTDEDITYIMNLADADKDGKIDIQEFQTM